MLEPDTIKKVKIKKNPIKIYLGDCLKKLDSIGKFIKFHQILKFF